MSFEKIVLSAPRDTFIFTSPDSLWVGNWPSPFLEAGPNIWVTTVLPILASSALSFLIAFLIYHHQRKNIQKDQMRTAFNLYYAICDEMDRGRNRVWSLIESRDNPKTLRSPFVLDAKESLVPRLTEVMSSGWQPRSIFKFYDLLISIASHHNRAAAIAKPHALDVMNEMRKGLRNTPQDTSVRGELRAIHDAQDYAFKFALASFDHETEDSLTHLFIEAVEELKLLGDKIRPKQEVDIIIPSREEREKQLALIRTKMSNPHEPGHPYSGLVEEDEEDPA